ncbi:conserved exported hypothetical protein [Thiocapsa sp. KS1]|nr:conserved exported hypothetical protein [Thiocapsa sp. KS1]
MRIPHLTAAILIIAVAAPTFARDSFGPIPPGSAFPPGSPWPGARGNPGPFPYPGNPYGTMPFGPPPWIDPPGLLAPPAPPFAEPSRTPPMQPGAFDRGSRHLSISRRATPDAYLVEIRLGNIDPEEVQILPQGRGLRIAYRTRAEEFRQDTFDGGYGQGYSIVSGSASQRLPLPPDADVAAMSREVTADRIQLRVPRMDPRRPAPWATPSRPDRNAESARPESGPE